MTSISTLSRADIYDYLRCPKIVSIKTYRLVHPARRRRIAARREPQVSAAVIGKIGEAAVASALSIDSDAEGEDVDKEIARMTESKVATQGIRVPGMAREILAETVEGLRDTRKYIRKEYGKVRVVGNGRCKNGPFPGEALPDLVALSPRNQKPILIEVKNGRKASATDRFQASFYNTVARETGVLVQEERLEDDEPEFLPKVHYNSITDTLLVYPIGKTYEKITDRIDMNHDRLQEIWEAKQLGLLGKSPSTDCDSKCPHHRLKVHLPEGSLEPAKPIPLIYAKGLVESGYDLDLDYLRSYSYVVDPNWDIGELIEEAQENKKRKETVIQAVVKETRLPEDVVRRMFFEEQEWPEPKKVFREMANEFEPWERMLSHKWMRKVKQRSSSQASRIYTIPEESDRFVKRSWDKWD
jgi:hypothetical protein